MQTWHPWIGLQSDQNRLCSTLTKTAEAAILEQFMPELTPEGENIVAGIAQRYGISAETVKMMLDAVARGGGSMAQFYLPELGGNGQWMRGGMTMVGDMFNYSLKATVDNLCTELSNLLANQPGIVAPVRQYQSQTQGGGTSGDGVSLFVPQSSFSSGTWWPSELGNPSSTGAQNSLRYAYFPSAHRLAIDYGGRVEVYDTLDHNIQGFGQQQSGDASITFTSQYGVVRVDSLPRVDRGEASANRPAEETPGPPATPYSQAPATPSPQAPATPYSHAPATPYSQAPATPYSQAPATPYSQAPATPYSQAPATPSSQDAGGGGASSIPALIEQLAQLKEKGILTDEEFAVKKADLLKRL